MLRFALSVCWRVALAVVLVAMAAPPAPLEAHAEYARSTPQAGARIPRAPARVDVWFTQELFRRIGANNLEVHAPDGSRVDSGVPVIDDADRTHLSIGLEPDLEAGTYRVRWFTLSAIDGDPAEGEFEFTLDPSAPEPTPPCSTKGAATPSNPRGLASSEGAAFPWWALIVASAIGAAGVLGAWALRAPVEGEAR